MMHSFFLFLTSLVSILLLDFLWLGILMRDFYLRNLSFIGRIENGTWHPNLMSAFLVYVCIALGIVFFVLPRVNQNTWIVSSLLWGGFFGLVTYGLYEWTNHSLLKGWPMNVVVADILWGIILCAFVTLVVLFVDLTWLRK